MPLPFVESTLKGWVRGGALAALAAMALPLMGGCPPEKLPGARTLGLGREVSPDRDRTLLDIGERSLDTGERLEEQGFRQGALEAYERAVWAFRYHERLTGDTPLLMEDALDSVERLREEGDE